MTPNSAFNLVNIVVGTNYAPVQTAQTIQGQPSTSVPTGIVTIAGPMTGPIFALFCTANSTGNTVVRALGAPDDGSADITFPSGSFKQGVVYYMYLKNLVADGGAAFVGYQYAALPVVL
jgi:hypothetical protein